MADFEYKFDMNLIENMLGEGLDARLLDFATVVVDDAKRIAPKRTGVLRDSIGYEKKKSGEIEITALAPYAAFVEFGTKFKAARPFLLPSIHKNEKILTREGKE